jgi:AcrR family transcriptional regulator
MESITAEEPPRRQRRPQEKLARILASATTIFGEEGYARARIHSVCRAAGVSIGTFYDHFENKADLLLQVAEQASETLPMPDPATLPQLEQSIAALTAAPSAGVSRAWLEAIRIEPGLFAASERLRGVFFGRYTQWVAEARARRRIRSALDDEVTARTVLSLLREAVTGAYGPTDQRVSDMARAIWFVLYAE